MRNYIIWWSFVCLVIFVILFGLLSTGLLPGGQIGKYLIFSMIVLPLLGTIFGVVSTNKSLKWVLVFFNFIAFLSFIYIILLGLGMGEA